jgi:hypothetical protein
MSIWEHISLQNPWVRLEIRPEGAENFEDDGDEDYLLGDRTTYLDMENGHGFQFFYFRDLMFTDRAKDTRWTLHFKLEDENESYASCEATTDVYSL